jgi:hypothetical protein
MTLKSLREPVSRRSLLMLPLLAASPRLRAQSGPYVVPAGLAADGATLNTRAIQAAIEQCAAARSGTDRTGFPQPTTRKVSFAEGCALVVPVVPPQTSVSLAN